MEAKDGIRKASRSNLTRHGSSKTQLKKHRVVEACPKSVEPLRNEIIPEDKNSMKISAQKTHSHSFENLDFSDDTKSELRNDKKLFHTSTTELYEKPPLQRSSSFFSTSRSSLTSGSFVGTSSNVTLSSTGSSGYGTLTRQGQNEPKPNKKEECDSQRIRLSSNSKFNEYLHSTSSWEWEDDDSREVPELKEPWIYRKRTSSYRNSISSDSSDLIQFETSSSQANDFPEVNLRTTVGEEQASTSFALAASGIVRASCPTLNADAASPAVLSTDLSSKFRITKNDSSKSTFEIGKAKAGSVITSSKSTNFISSVRSISFLNTKRPITLRFTPSGLTETSRVVWMMETGDHTGTVKWVGKIRDKFYAGVEFEKPIGNSSGIYGYGHGLQVRLFTCKLGYGRFIPVDELILYEDFYENQKTGFICIICRDDFIEPGESEDGLDNPDKFMVATKCGHLFHQICLNQWFNEKSAALQNCPYCHFPMERNDTIRIFPAQLK